MSNLLKPTAVARIGSYTVLEPMVRHPLQMMLLCVPMEAAACIILEAAVLVNCSILFVVQAH